MRPFDHFKALVGDHACVMSALQKKTTVGKSEMHRIDASLHATKNFLRVVRDQVFPRRQLSGDIGWYNFAHACTWSSRTALINHLIAINGYRRYLEIGVRNRTDNFSRIQISEYVGVDPDPRAQADYQMTSDEYFSLDGIGSFDIIFIDGMHHADYVQRDIENSLNHLSPNGTIVLHDLNPPSAEHEQEISYNSKLVSHEWNGTCWKAFADYRARRHDLEMYTVDTDWGCGIIREGSQELYCGPRDTYQDLEENRQAILNLISVREFLMRNPMKLPPAPNPV